MPTDPVAIEIAPRAGGSVEVLRSNRWAALDPSNPVSGARGVRTLDRGALVAFGGPGDSRARLWLRANSTALLAQDDRGVLYVAVEQGRARLMVSDPNLPAFAWSEGRFVAADDVLIERTADRTAVVATRDRPHLAAWSLAIETEPEPSGFGRLETGAGTSRALLQLRRVKVDVVTHGGIAVTEIDHVFFNPGADRMEGTFRFPVPDGAMVRGLAMEIDGRLMEGEIVEREKARRTYESIVDQMQDPALLEWEQGNWFKLRVFPIEPTSEKRVVLRYATPLARTLDGWEYTYNVSAPERAQTVGELIVTFNGKVVEHATDLGQGKEIAIAVADGQIPAVMREEIDGASFVAVRIRPDWDRIPPANRRGNHRKLLAIVDTSRSSLEARDLALETLDLVLGELTDGDRFQVAAADLDVQPHGNGFVAPSDDAIAAATRFIESIEPDGATNLAAMLDYAGKSGATEVVYIGDGTPTWGETDPRKLGTLAGRGLGSATLYAAILGKGANVDLWAELTGRLGGRAARPRTPLEARQFAFFLGRADHVARIEGAHIAAVEGSTLFPDRPTTLFAGDELVAVLRTDAGKQAPARIKLAGRAAGKPIEQTVALADARPGKLIAQQWAVKQIAALDAAGDREADIVELSRKFGVLSRQTSLLVLESEQAYRQHQIERQNAEALVAQNDNAPRVTGGDLESLSGRAPSLSPDHIQPGDPEIAIPAPADAQSVVVVFPFGDTKLAEWDDERKAWLVRFLIDKDTPDGRYVVAIRVTHADGQIETLRLPYFVDTSAPTMKLTVKRRGRSYAITARQERSRKDVLKNDAEHVEVVVPGGEIIELRPLARGKFEAEWTPSAPLSGAISLDVVVTDGALNQASLQLTIDPEAL